MTLLGATTQSGPKSDGIEGLLHIPQRSSITGASRSDYLVSYPGHSLVASYSCAEMHSAAQADWAKQDVIQSHFLATG